MLMECKKLNRICIKLEIEGKINIVFLGDKENAFYWYFFKLFRI